MWIADMDFRVPDCVVSAIEDYMKTGVFGYYVPRPSYHQAFIDWERKYHGYQVKEEWLRFAPGVVPAFNWFLQVFTEPGDAVIVQTPVYYPFMHAVKNNSRRLVCCDLINTGGIYTVDFTGFEKKIVENGVKLFILSSPHNPAGRVWKRDELKAMLDICKKHGVYVISDEIHHDIVFGDNVHIPSATVGDYDKILVTLTAATKTFNLAGLVGSYHIIYNPYLRDRVRAKSSKPHYNDMNVLSMHALIGAYKPEGYEWVEELRETISGNVNFACDYITQHFEGVSVSKPEGTYMLFLDCTDWCKAHGKTIAEVEKAGWNVGVAWQDGRMFHGPCAIRMNLALPLTRVQEAFERLDKYVFNGEWV